MNTFFSYQEGSILIRLLIAHCLTDFLLQPSYWVEGKKNNIWKSKYLWLHGLMTGLIAWLLLWNFNDWWLIIYLHFTYNC